MTQDEIKILDNILTEAIESPTKFDNIAILQKAKNELYKLLDAPTTILDLGMGLSDDLNTVIGKWLAYKQSRNEKYTERGLKSLYSRIRNEVKQKGETIVIAIINQSINRHWQGITWDCFDFLKPEIDKLFEMTWELSPNPNGKEGARQYYHYLFKEYYDLEKAKQFARVIYKVFKSYVDSLDDTKYCKAFEKWLRSEVPQNRKH